MLIDKINENSAGIITTIIIFMSIKLLIMFQHILDYSRMFKHTTHIPYNNFLNLVKCNVQYEQFLTRDSMYYIKKYLMLDVPVHTMEKLKSISSDRISKENYQRTVLIKSKSYLELVCYYDHLTRISSGDKQVFSNTNSNKSQSDIYKELVEKM
jgi:hypothetical protein